MNEETPNYSFHRYIFGVLIAIRPLFIFILSICIILISLPALYQPARHIIIVIVLSMTLIELLFIETAPILFNKIGKEKITISKDGFVMPYGVIYPANLTYIYIKPSLLNYLNLTMNGFPGSLYCVNAEIREKKDFYGYLICFCSKNQIKQIQKVIDIEVM